MGRKTSGVSKRAIVSYVLDYVIIVVLFVLFAFIDRAEPFHQPFSLTNITLQYPMAQKERVSTGLLVIVAVLIPAALIAIFAILIDPIISKMEYKRHGTGTGNHSFMDRLWELNCGILGLLLAEGATFVITQALKNLIGKPRPDFIDRCQPVSGAMDRTPYGLSTSEICTQTDAAILKDGYRSFPSGHSSTAWAGLFYLSLYLAGKLHVLDHRGEVWRTFFVLVPVLSAALIAGTRVIDARHHGFDVIVGSLIGLLVAWGAYRQYFYPVAESDKRGRAFPARTWGRDPLPSTASGVDGAAGLEPVRRRGNGYANDEESRVGTGTGGAAEYSTAANNGNSNNVAYSSYGAHTDPVSQPYIPPSSSSTSNATGGQHHRAAQDPFASGDSTRSYELQPVQPVPAGLTGASSSRA